jgi:hypothetical protein
MWMPEDREAEPTMPLDDPRLRFFLEHREQIREWAAMADEVAEAVADILRGLAPDVVARVGDRHDVLVSERIAGENPYGTVLHRQAWTAGTPPLPFVGVSLAWDGKRVDPVGGWPGAQLPYVGVSTSHFTSEGKQIEQTLRGWVKQRFQEPYGYLKGSYWVAYRPIRAPADWWQDVPAWRERVIDQLMLAWDECSPVVDEALTETRGRPGATAQGTNS